jgi:molybdopterin/thiamine biosynthesis adenylyltransferase
MSHLFQVGVGSGGMPVLDAVARDARITRVTIVEPDAYQSHNVHRHIFPDSAVGQSKAALARQWLQERLPNLTIETLAVDLLDADSQSAIEAAVADADIGVCAADNEPAKFHFDALMRRHRKPWTLGEVLSGGIGGFVHVFAPDGPCYGCVASHLQRSVQTEAAKAPDYSQPNGAVAETMVPASKAAIQAIASLHALLTLRLLEEGAALDPGFSSLLFTLQRVPGVFEEAFRPYRFRIPRSAECLICRPDAASLASSTEDLDVALDQALARLGNV